MLRRSLSKYTKDTLQFFGQPISFLLRQQTMLLLLAVAITESAFSSSAMTLTLYFVRLQTLNQTSPVNLEIPIILTIYYLVSLSTASFFGSLSDRIGRRTLLIIGTALAAISFIPFPMIYPLYSDYTPSFIILVAANAIKGLASAMIAGPVLAMFADISQEKTHGETMGKFYLAKSAGAASGFLFGGITWELLEQNAFYFFMIIMLGATFLYIFRFKEPRSFSRDPLDSESKLGNFQEVFVNGGSMNPFTTVLQSLQNKQFQKFAIAWLAYSTLVGAAINYITPLFLSKVTVGSSILGFVFLVGAGIMGLIQPTIGKLSDTLGRKPFLIIGCVGMSLLVVMISAIINLQPNEIVELIYNPITGRANAKLLKNIEIEDFYSMVGYKGPYSLKFAQNAFNFDSTIVGIGPSHSDYNLQTPNKSAQFGNYELEYPMGSNSPQLFEYVEQNSGTQFPYTQQKRSLYRTGEDTLPFPLSPEETTNGNNYIPQSTVQVNGFRNRIIGKNNTNITINGNRNLVNGGVKNINIVGNNNIIESGVENVTIIGSNQRVSQSNISIINGVTISESKIIQQIDLVEGSYNEVQNPYSPVKTIWKVDGSKNSVTNLGSDDINDVLNGSY